MRELSLEDAFNKALGVAEKKAAKMINDHAPSFEPPIELAHRIIRVYKIAERIRDSIIELEKM
jgi:hypothetical protein